MAKYGATTSGAAPKGSTKKAPKRKAKVVGSTKPVGPVRVKV